MKTLIGALVLIIVAGSVYIVSMQPPSSTETQASDLVATTSTPLHFTATDFSWKVAPAASYEETMPHQILSLVAAGRTYEIGEYMGCSGISDEGPLEAGEIVRTTCWFAGAGDHVSVFKEQGKYVVKTRWIQESGGPDVQADPQGEFGIVFTLE